MTTSITASLPPLFVSLAVAILAGYVLRSNPGSHSHRWFATFSTLSATWALGIAGLPVVQLGEFPLRLVFTSASIIPPAFLAFSYHFPSPSPARMRPAVTFSLLLGGALALCSAASSLVVSNPRVTPEGFARDAGTLYPAFAAYCTATFAASFAILARKWRLATGHVRAQLRHLFVGAGLATAGAATTNLFVPLLTGQSNYAPLGPIFLLIFAAFVSHAIIRHRLMQVRLVVRQGLTTSIATAISLLPISVILISFSPALLQGLNLSQLAGFLVAVALATALAPSTRDLAARLVNKYVYRAQPDFRATLRHASRRLVCHTERRTLLALIADSIAEAVEPEAIAIYLRAGQQLRRKAVFPREKEAKFDVPEYASDVLLGELATRKEAVTAGHERRGPHHPDSRVAHELAALGWAVVLPLVADDEVIGAVAIGPKRSGDPFFAHDLDLLSALAGQAGIAVKNAQLYAQVVLAHEYLENILGTMESGVAAVDSAGRITLVNRAAEAFTGLSAEAVRSQSVDVLPPPLRDLLRTTLADGQGRVEPDMELPAGERPRPIMCTTSLLRDPEGSPVGAVAVFSDLTPLKELEVQRRRAELLTYFEMLASSLAHELKNPLVALKTFTQLVPRRHHEEKFLQDFSRIMEREIGRMERLIERLQALARPPARTEAVVDLRQPLQDALTLVRPAFDDKGIVVRASLGEREAALLGDPYELEQLFLNLLLNAHEATPPGGTVTVELVTEGMEALVRVADSGPGIPAELRDHVFEPFVTTKPRGLGLGLTISGEIVSAYRGKLLAANAPGGGAVFTVRMPLGAPAREREEVRRSEMTTRE